LIACTFSSASAAQVQPDQVDDAIKRGVAYLYSQQKATGQWESQLRRDGQDHSWENRQGDTFGGYTALCTFALLEAGEKPSDPRVAKAIAFLKTCDMVGIYAIGIRAMVWSRLPQTPEIKLLLQDDVRRLIGAMVREGQSAGMWHYLTSPPATIGANGPYDRSVSQFAVLGLWAAVQAGASVPPELWRLQDTAWRSGQGPDGSWSYSVWGENEVNPSMTAAGAATLLIVQDVLGSLNGAGGAAVPIGNDIAINRAIRKLDGWFGEIKASGTYAWYGVERIATAGGFRYLGKHDWFEVAAADLISRQLRDGSWGVGTSPGCTPLSETALGVLVLAHGRAPVLMAKLNYSSVTGGVARNAPWHQRPRDAGNLTRFVGTQLEQSFNWQVVHLGSPVEDLLEAPTLLMTGAKTVVVTPRERAKIKAYLDGGGMIIATSEAAASDKVVGHDEFTKSILMLGQQLYPGYSFRLLPPTHPIYTEQPYKLSRWKTQPTVWGLSNGVRELIVLLPEGDYGRAWNTNAWRSDPFKFEVGANILEYAIAREPSASKGTGHYIPPVYWTEPATRPTAANPQGRELFPDELPGIPVTAASETQPATGPATRPVITLPADSRFMTIGRLRVGGNWDPEPGAWPRMVTLLANNFHLFVDTQTVDADAKQLAGLKLVHWTGTTAVQLSPQQRQAIAGYLKHGGTLLVDAAGGSREFADSAQAELSAALELDGKELGVILPADDQLYRLRDGRITRFRYRRFATGRLMGKLDAPRLRGFDYSGRTVLFFSREDLTAGCVGQNVDGIVGYSPQTATAIVRNIVLTASRRK
jgi:hypothetical protein